MDVGIYNSGVVLYSNLTGQFSASNQILDQVSTAEDPAVAGTPWYAKSDLPNDPATNTSPTPFFRPSSGVTSTTIIAYDTPASGPPLFSDMGQAVEPNGDNLVKMILEFDFMLYVCAQTLDPENGANNVYTSEASAAWSFYGGGTVANGVWSAFPQNVQNPYPQAGVTAPSNWNTSSQALGVQPLMAQTGPIFNTLLRAETFSTRSNIMR